MIAESTSIDTTAGTEHTELVEAETFLGSIVLFVGDKEEGAEEDKKHSDRPGEILFPTDGSRLDSGRMRARVALWDPE